MTLARPEERFPLERALRGIRERFADAVIDADRMSLREHLGGGPASPPPAGPAAPGLEREMRDLLGVIPEGHPDPRPLVAHDGWPEGAYPLRKDFAPPHTWSWAPRFAFSPVEGEGVFELPVGPTHAGIIESRHFRFP